MTYINKHRLSYCSHCKTKTIVCGKCKNNTCNGGYGTIIVYTDSGEGKIVSEEIQCDKCPEAYDLTECLECNGEGLDFTDHYYCEETEEEWCNFCKVCNGEGIHKI